MCSRQGFVVLLSLLSAAVYSEGVVYHGTMREDAKPGDRVVINPPLYVRNTTGLTGVNICGYTLYMSYTDMPFGVVITERDHGYAHIVLLRTAALNYSARPSYDFQVAGHDCDQGTHAAKEQVHIDVTQVHTAARRPAPVPAHHPAPVPAHHSVLANHPAPMPDHRPAPVPVHHPAPVPADHLAPAPAALAPHPAPKTHYAASVPEGRLVATILRTPQAGACHYRLVTKLVPFAVSDSGVLSNTQPLVYADQHNYILHLAGSDGCRPSILSVNVEVTRSSVTPTTTCQAKWTGFESRVDYTPGDQPRLFAKQAALDLCGQSCASPVEVSVKVELETKHDAADKGCVHDTYSIQAQRKLCGAAGGGVDLLANGSGGSHQAGRSGASGDERYAFDGTSSAVAVPPAVLNHTLAAHFTVSVWMRHNNSLARDQHADKRHSPKEHIVCNADGDGKNRHHYALFTHNCKLILLLRQEASTGAQMNVLKPAEWRWKPAAVCDDQWHHYAVVVDFPRVRLYVDGKFAVEHNKEPQTFDDWPLHRTKKVHFTKLVVGACWAGGKQHLVQYFRGYLAGLTIVKGASESDRVIRCLNDCQEKLAFHAADQSHGSMTVTFNSEMTVLTIRGDDVANVEQSVRRVAYVNSRLFPTAGRRAVTVTTQLKCANVGVPVAAVRSAIYVQRAAPRVLRLVGDSRIVFSEAQLRQGSRPLRGIRLMSEAEGGPEAKEQDTADKMAATLFTSAKEPNPRYKTIDNDHYDLDSCVIRLPPGAPLVAAVERFTVPASLETQLHLTHTQLPDGALVISGVAKVSHYEMLLHQIHYFHSKPHELNSRTFIVACSERNGRFASNELTIKMEVSHVAHMFAEQPHAIQAESMQVAQMKSLTMNGDSVMKIAPSATGVGMVIIIVVCVSLIALMALLVVVRIRAAQGRRRQLGGAAGGVDERQEMEWDNSELTITVNPMEQEMSYMDQRATTMKCEDSDSDSDDDDSICYNDEIESSEEEAEKVRDKDLEWDNSTLSF